MPKLAELNNFAEEWHIDVVLTKKYLLKMELFLLSSFNWNLCLPTAAHYIDYYLFASVTENDLYCVWRIASVAIAKTFVAKYAHYFLEVSLQGNLLIYLFKLYLKYF